MLKYIGPEVAYVLHHSAISDRRTTCTQEICIASYKVLAAYENFWIEKVTGTWEYIRTCCPKFEQPPEFSQMII
jgi:hypothetical protein